MNTTKGNATALSAPPPAASAQEIRTGSFRLIVPAGWIERSIYCFGGPTMDGFQCTVTIVQEAVPAGTDVSAHAGDQLTQLAGQLEDYCLIRSEKRMLGTRPCHWAQYTWKNAEGVVVKQAQWTLVRGETVFVLTATALDNTYDQVSTKLEELAIGFAPLG